MANLQDQKRTKTEDHIISIPKIQNVSQVETSQSSIDTTISEPAKKNSQFDTLKLSVVGKPQSQASLSDYVYDKFFSWVEGPIKISSEAVAEVMKPLVVTAYKYLKTIDLDKIERDMTQYAMEKLKVVLVQSAEIKTELEKFLNEKPEPGKPITYYDTFRSYCKMGFDLCCEYGAKACANAADFLSTSLGKERFEWLRDNIYRPVMNFLELIRTGFRFITSSKEPDPMVDQRIAAIGVLDTESGNADRAAAKEALEMVKDISSFAENYFGNKHKGFFSHVITDEDSCDGIRKSQPEMVRPELAEDLERPVFDPFPSYVNRVKDAKESEEKAKLMEISGEQFVRVGIDNEISSADKLKILTASQKRVA